MGSKELGRPSERAGWKARRIYVYGRRSVSRGNVDLTLAGASAMTRLALSIMLALLIWRATGAIAIVSRAVEIVRTELPAVLAQAERAAR